MNTPSITEGRQAVAEIAETMRQQAEIDTHLADTLENFVTLLRKSAALCTTQASNLEFALAIPLPESTDTAEGHIPELKPV